MNNELRVMFEEIGADMLRPELEAAGFDGIDVRHASELGLQCFHTVGGFTGETVPSLWNGTRPGIVIADRGAIFGNDDAFNRYAYTSIFCHELAHVARSKQMFTPQDTSSDIKTLVKVSSTLWYSGKTRPKWIDHDCGWIRACLHICHRMSVRGFVPLLEIAVSLSSYGLTDHRAYVEALGWETRYLERESLGDVMNTAAPKAFTDLFLRDVLFVDGELVVSTKP